MKKGRHRRYEEARALKQNEDLDLDSIFESLNVDEPKAEGESPAFDAWSDEFEEEEAVPEMPAVVRTSAAARSVSSSVSSAGSGTSGRRIVCALVDAAHTGAVDLAALRRSLRPEAAAVLRVPRDEPRPVELRPDSEVTEMGLRGILEGVPPDPQGANFFDATRGTRGCWPSVNAL